MTKQLLFLSLLIIAPFAISSCSEGTEEEIAESSEQPSHVPVTAEEGYELEEPSATEEEDVEGGDPEPLPVSSDVMASWGEDFAEQSGGFLDTWNAYAGDVNNDGVVDSIGLFSISPGGNAVNQYAAVFIGTESGLTFDAVAEIGASGVLMVENITSVEEGTIFGEAMLWTEEDAHCCPSREEGAALMWEPGALTMVE